MAGVISLGGGIPNPALFDHEGLKIAADAVLSQHFGEAFQYGLTEGSGTAGGDSTDLYWPRNYL
jgi:DNA-binding transcriptional MocR family regulator